MSTVTLKHAARTDARGIRGMDTDTNIALLDLQDGPIQFRCSNPINDFRDDGRPATLVKNSYQNPGFPNETIAIGSVQG